QPVEARPDQVGADAPASRLGRDPHREEVRGAVHVLDHHPRHPGRDAADLGDQRGAGTGEVAAPIRLPVPRLPLEGVGERAGEGVRRVAQRAPDPPVLGLELPHRAHGCVPASISSCAHSSRSRGSTPSSMWRAKSVLNRSKKSVPRTELPCRSSCGAQLATPKREGRAAMIPPPTPDFAGRPTSLTQSPALSYIPQVSITESTCRAATREKTS